MTKKPVEELMFPIENYHDKVKGAIKNIVKSTPWLTYDEKQIKASLKKGFEWLHNCSPKQDETLGTIIRCTCRSLVYQGMIVKVKNKLTTTQTWQWKAGAQDPDSNAVIITGEEISNFSDKQKDYFKTHNIPKHGKALLKVCNENK